MREDAPSKTAQGVALRRAAHQLLDRPRVFEDPLAVAMAGPRAAEEILSAPERWATDESRRLRAFLAARSRYAEERLAEAIGRGVRQYAILGAGLDTYAYRDPHACADLRVFEVDHPATQEWKRARLRQAGIPVPDWLTFVPVDFERQALAGELAAAGFRADRPAFFAWLGVLIYLTLESAGATLQFIGGCPPLSGVAFDYAIPASEPNPAQASGRDRLAARVARAGEPFRLFFEAPRLAVMLHQLGFRDLEDLGAAEIDALYFKDRVDGLRLGLGRGRLASAWV